MNIVVAQGLKTLINCKIRFQLKALSETLFTKFQQSDHER